MSEENTSTATKDEGIDNINPYIDPDREELEELETEAKKRKLREGIKKRRIREARLDKEIAEIEGDEDPEEKSSAKSRFVQQLMVEGNKLFATRNSPQKFRGMELPKNVGSWDCPISLPEVEQELQELHGGGRFRLRLVDEDLKVVNNRGLTLSGAPRIPDDYMEGPVFPHGMMPMDDDDDEYDPTDPAQALKKEIEIAQLQKRLQQINGSEDAEEKMQRLVEAATAPYRDQLEAMNRRREMDELKRELLGGGGGGANREEVDDLKIKNRELQSANDRLREEIGDLKAEMREAKARAEFQEQLRSLESKFSTGQSSESAQAMMLQNMISTINASSNNANERIEKMVELLVTNKVDPNAKNPTAQMLEMANLMSTLKNTFDPSQPADFKTELLTTVRDVAPQVLGAIGSGGMGNQPIGEADLDAAADRAAADVIRQQSATPYTAPVAPPPVALPPAAPATPHVSGAAEVPVQPVTVQQESAVTTNVAAERQRRVDIVLTKIIEEIQMNRPNGAQWPAIAWEILPGDVRDEIVAAQTDGDVFEAIRKDASGTVMMELWKYLQADPANHQFVISGVQAIQAHAKATAASSPAPAAPAPAAPAPADPPPYQEDAPSLDEVDPAEGSVSNDDGAQA